MKLANLKPLTSNFINETYMDEDLYEAEHEGAEDEMLPPEPEDANGRYGMTKKPNGHGHGRRRGRRRCTCRRF